MQPNKKQLKKVSKTFLKNAFNKLSINRLCFEAPKNPVASRVLKVKEGESFGMIEFDPAYMAEAVRHLVRGKINESDFVSEQAHLAKNNFF